MKSFKTLNPELVKKFLDHDRLGEDLIEARQQRIAQIFDTEKPLTTKNRAVNVDVIYVSQSDNLSSPWQ